MSQTQLFRPTVRHPVCAALLAGLLGLSQAALAKLPALSDDAKAKAAEAAAKAAHGNKVADFQLCQSMDKVAARYIAAKKKAGDEVKPTATPPCADPGPFVYPPPAAAAPAAVTAAAATSAKKPDPAPAPAKK
jgi:hypothetical protein